MDRYCEKHRTRHAITLPNKTGFCYECVTTCNNRAQQLELTGGIKYYTGIGSREAPKDILELMKATAQKMDAAGWVLRSGGAKGADTAFANGATNKVIYHPNDFKTGYNQFEFPAWAVQAAREQCWECPLDNMRSPYVRALITRNMMQIMGLHGDVESNFVICWVPTLDPCDKDAGGTRYATRFAVENGVKIFNLNNPKHRARVEQWLEKAT